jgi:hypothetical protein
MDIYRQYFERCAFADENGKYSQTNHWKGPLRVVVEEEDVPLMIKAIEHFAGGVTKVNVIHDSMFLIESKGYYHYIGS